MPHNLFIHIDPDNCLTFLNQAPSEKNVSARLNTFIESINALHATINQLKKQIDFQFDENQKKAISRGAFFTLTRSLEEKFAKQKVITLADLQSILNKEFHIKDEPTINFIIASLLEPHSLPFALSVLAYTVLIDNSNIWSNECAALDSIFKYTLKANQGANECIVFKLRMNLRNVQFPENASLGSLTIQFGINQKKQITLLPLDMEFNFVDKKGLKQFKNEFCKDFQDWIFLPKTYWQTSDIWVIPILLGCLVGLIAMISLLALSLTPISPLLLPPLSLTLGLGLASVIHTYVHMSIKKELQRPIHLFNRKPMQTTVFSNHPRLINNAIESEAQLRLNTSEVSCMES